MADNGRAPLFNKLEGSQDQGKFKISKKILISIAESNQLRKFSEEIDIIEKYGGESWLQDGLMTSFRHGLPGDQQDFQERDREFGNNKKPKHVSKNYCELVWNGLKDFNFKILVLAAIASIVIDVIYARDDEQRNIAWIQGFAILTAVMITVIANAVNDYQKEKQFQKLNCIADERKRVTVIRGGQKQYIHQSDVLVGDVVMIFEGMDIPADGFLIEASELTADECRMTGETDPVQKNLLAVCKAKRDQIREDGNEVIRFSLIFFFLNQNMSGPHHVPSPFMMSGTKVLTGEGKMLIIVVGDSSCFGKVQHLLRSDEEEVTPLQMKLTALAENIGKFGSYSALLVVFAMLLRFGIERGIQQDWDNIYIQQILGYFIVGITVAVITNSDGLPLALTVNLAYSTKQMLADQNLVRKKTACETMGGVSMICSEKTGILTQNNMTLVSVWNDEMIDIDAYTPTQKMSQYWNDAYGEYFIQAAIINSSAMLKPEPKGSKTDIALLEFITRCGIDVEEQRIKYPSSMKFPFSSTRKRMSTIIELEGGQRRLVCKGASELVLQACYDYHSKSGSVQPLTEDLQARIEQAIEKMAGKGLRTICFAYKDVRRSIDLKSKDSQGVFDCETCLIFLGILGIKDVLRQEVPLAIRQCKMAGIKVRMVTGDNKLTAQAIARECGIIEIGDNNEFTVVEGPIFMEKIGGVVCKSCRVSICYCPRDEITAKRDNMVIRVDTINNKAAFDKIYPQICVMARCRPEDKYALVTGLTERGHVVAVTGDGTYDASALKKADVGFAMGIVGTDVAREAADIILLDDNFNSIIKTVMWGRNIYDNIRKFIRFQLTANIVAVVLTLVGAALLRQEILRPIQMLWLNLIMDTLGSLALVTEPPNEKILNRAPQDKTEQIISRNMYKLIFGTAAVMITVVLIVVFQGDTFLPEVDDMNSFFNSDYKKFWKFSDIKCKATDFKYKTTSKQCSDKNYAKCFCRTLNECAEIICEANPCVGTCTKIKSGRLFDVKGQYDYFWFYINSLEPSRHFTYVFNIFIMLQIFNFFNARRINNELNIFQGIFKHTAFLIIVPCIFALQIIMVTFGSKAIGLYPYYGLTLEQWGICIGFGSISLVAGFILKFLREDLCCCGQTQTNPVEHQELGILAVEKQDDPIPLKKQDDPIPFRRRYSSIDLNRNYQNTQLISQID